MVRVLQRVALEGVSCVVFRITSCTLAGVIVGGLPGCVATWYSAARPPSSNGLGVSGVGLRQPSRSRVLPAGLLLRCDLQPSRDLLILQPRSGQQDNLRSFHGPRRRPASSGDRLQEVSLVGTQNNESRHAHRVRQPDKSFRIESGTNRTPLELDGEA